MVAHHSWSHIIHGHTSFTVTHHSWSHIIHGHTSFMVTHHSWSHIIHGHTSFMVTHHSWSHIINGHELFPSSVALRCSSYIGIWQGLLQLQAWVSTKWSPINSFFSSLIFLSHQYSVSRYTFIIQYPSGLHSQTPSLEL